MDSFYQTGIMERNWGGGLEGIIILVYKPMLFLHTLIPHHPPPSSSTSRAPLPLRTVGH